MLSGNVQKVLINSTGLALQWPNRWKIIYLGLRLIHRALKVLKQLTQNKSLTKKIKKNAAADKINSHCTSTGKGTAAVKSAHSHDIGPSFDIFRTARDKQKV